MSRTDVVYVVYEETLVGSRMRREYEDQVPTSLPHFLRVTSLTSTIFVKGGRGGGAGVLIVGIVCFHASGLMRVRLAEFLD